MPREAVSISEDEKYQVEADVRTLKEAELIKKDEPRLDKAMSLMGDEIDAMSSSMEDAARKRFKNTNFNS